MASTLGLKKLFLALGQGTRPKLGKARSYSVEQLRTPAPGPASHTSTPKVKRAPSLQSLHLVSLKGPSQKVGDTAAHGMEGDRRNEVQRRPPQGAQVEKGRLLGSPHLVHETWLPLDTMGWAASHGSVLPASCPSTGSS